MIRKILPLLLGLSLAFAGCSSSDAPQAENGQQNQEPAAAEPAEDAASSDCVRGEPEALLASQSEFTRLSAGEAEERVQTGAPIQLKIHHFGCTHYALDFEFTWPDPQMPEPQVSLKEAAALIEKLPLKETYQPVMKSLAAALREMAQEPYKQPLVMSETETLTATTPALNVLRVRYDVAL